MLLGTLGASLLGNLLIGKGAMAKWVSEETKSTSQRRRIYRTGKGKVVLGAGYGRPSSSALQNNNKMDF